MEAWFENKVALVTGGGDGIGRATALLFAARGAKVVVTDVNRAGADDTAKAIRANGGEATALDGDVTQEAVVAAFVAETVARYGRLDCAFNNAGIVHPRDCEWDEAAARRIVDVNLLGVMSCIRHEIPVMLRNGGGTIVNTASLSGFIASRTVIQPAYTASKHGVIGITKSAALQHARANIRVNAVCPGVTMTTMVRAVMESSPEAKRALEELSPMGRVGQPNEIAEAAIWLCSDKSSYVNGHALVIDGGSVVE